MRSLSAALDWNQLLPLRHFAWDTGSFQKHHARKTILLTGAGGSIGSALARAMASAAPDLLILLDHSEQNLYQIETELAALPDAPPYVAVLGDAGDRALLSALFEEHRPSLIYHAAAFKHVPLMEGNPLAAVRNNALATWHLARLAAKYQLPQLLLISTDKAANPHSILGASKRLAELAILRWNAPCTRTSALRLGNVLGSHGSVAPLFLKQIARGASPTVAHPAASRYFLTIQDAVNLIFSVASLSGAGELFLPEMGQPVRILDLAERLLQLTTPGVQKQRAIQFTGLRPGDKLNEDLLCPAESLKPSSLPGIHRIVGVSISTEVMESCFRKISAYVERRDLGALLDAIGELVPEYKPSRALQRNASARISAEAADD